MDGIQRYGEIWGKIVAATIFVLMVAFLYRHSLGFHTTTFSAFGDINGIDTPSSFVTADTGCGCPTCCAAAG